MKEKRNFGLHKLPYRLLLVLVLFLLATPVMNTYLNSPISGDAYGHLAELPGAQSYVMSKSIGNYAILVSD